MTTTAAAQAYDSANSNIDALIARLQAARQAEAQRAAQQPGHWGFAGQAQHLEQQLREIVERLEG